MGSALRTLKRELTAILLMAFVAETVFVISLLWIFNNLLHLDMAMLMITTISISFVFAALLTIIVGRLAVLPIELIVTALGHLESGASIVSAPNIETLTIGRSLTKEATKRIYEIAGSRDMSDVKNDKATDFKLKTIFSLMPSVVITLDSNGKILTINDTAKNYLGPKLNDFIGRPFSEVLHLQYSGAGSLEQWLEKVKDKKITDSANWQRVKLVIDDDIQYHFDMAAYYSKDEPHGFESIVALIDHSDRYQADENEMDFVSFAVHELRTPITLLRGYIEVLEEEIGEHLDPEMKSFIAKMGVSAAQLALFINNILNVTRIDNDQLKIERVEVDWRGFVDKSFASDFMLRAKVHDRHIKVDLPASLPTVAADPVSMYEVLSNLVDNAIKYSDDGGEILVRVYENSDNTIATSIQDFGIGIPQSVMANLFEKFYRSHRSKQNVGGTGLGLFLSKTIIEAHEGNIEVQSVEGQGAIFTFTLPTYESVADSLDDHHNDNIERGKHGWIKNHSMHRR